MQEQHGLLKRSDLNQKINTIENNFQQYKIYLSTDSKTKPVYLTIKENKITIGSQQCNQKQDILIQLNDFIGYNQEQVDADWIRLKLNVFSKKKKILRKIRRYIYQYPIFVNHDDKILEKFKCNLLSVATQRKFQNSKKKLKLMIYFNPNAGSNSKKHLDRTVDFLAFTNIHFDIFKTQRRNHCIQHINNQLDFGQYEGVVIISGDGLMHEFVNSKAVGVLPVTHVPGGSGNAFSKYQTALGNQACQTQQALYLALKGRIKKLNLVEFNMEKVERPIYSFLSLEWCFIADIDMNSQFLRFLGGLRFQVYAAWRLMFLKKYRGKFCYSTTSTNLPPLNQQITSNQFKKQQKVYLHQLITFIPYLSDKYEISPLLKLQDQAMDMQIINQEQGRMSLVKYMLNSDSGGQFDKQKKQKKQGFKFDWQKIKSFRLQPNGNERGVFGIDGQQYEAQKIQAKISDKKVLTFA